MLDVNLAPKLQTRNLIFSQAETFGVTKGKRKVIGMPQSQTAALTRHQEEEETFCSL